jgi:hypothetical protein
VTAVASVAAVAAGARVFVFSQAFSGVLGFSRIFLSFLWSYWAFSSFLGFPVLLGTLRGAFGYRRGPFVSFGVPLGPFGVPLVCARAFFRALWVPLASFWGRLGVPLGYLWGVFGRFGVTWAARGCPGVPKDAENQKTHVFVCFCPCVKKHVFLCVSRGGQGSRQQNTRVFVCFRIFEAEAATKQNTRIFVCFRGPVFGKHVFLWVSVFGPLLCDRESNVAICTCFCVFLRCF